VRQQDRAGLLTFAGQKRVYLPARARAQHLADLLAALEATRPEGPTDLAGILGTLPELLGRRQMVVVLSDLLGDVGGQASLAHLHQLRARGHEVVLFHILDPDEIAFPFAELTVFESMEDERKLLCDPRSLARAYRREMEAFLARWQDGAVESNLTYVRVETDRPLDRVLLDFLRLQEGRLA
jgi:uncharacterized protein (DUF58 family)